MVRDLLLRSCPGLTPELKHRLEIFAWRGRDEHPARPNLLEYQATEAEAERYRRWRARVCVDTTVFDEIGTMPPEQRRPEVMRRCQFDRIELGDVMPWVLDRVSVDGLIFHRVLLDAEIPAPLAREAIGLFAYPRMSVQTEAVLPEAKTEGAVLREGIAVQVSATEISLPGGPTLPLRGGVPDDGAELERWLTEQFSAIGVQSPATDDYEWQVLVFASRDAPASALVSIAEALKGPDYVLVVQLGERHFGAETIIDDRPLESASFVVGVNGEHFEVRETAHGEVKLRATIADPSGIERWAATISSDITVRIEDSGMTVQQFVSLRQALRGSECSLLAWHWAEDLPPGCQVLYTPLGG
ncbi:MAG: hypothetical protein AAF799_06120 [Myxococcota bacterium]